MKVQQSTYVLLGIAAPLMILGAILDLWFYTIAGWGLIFYIAWQYFVFASRHNQLALTVRRYADKQTVLKNAYVTVELAITSNMHVTGLFVDIIPPEFALVEGVNQSEISLRRGDTLDLRYTLQATGRADLSIEHSTFTIRNGLFTDTIYLQPEPLEVKQPRYRVTFDGESEGGAGGGTVSLSVQDLFRDRTLAGERVFSVLPYVAGDPPKAIHWKATAKANKLMIKEFAVEPEDSTIGTSTLFEGVAIPAGTPFNLVIDHGGSMGQGAPGLTELDAAVNIASRMVKFAVGTGSSIGVVTYDDTQVDTAIRLGDSPDHVSHVVKALNTIESRVEPNKLSFAKAGITGLDALRLRKQLALKHELEDDGDSRRFKDIVSYLHSHDDYYRRALQDAPVFRAINAAVSWSPAESFLALIGNLEGDMDPLMEGIRVATRHGAKVLIIAIYAEVFKPFDDAYVAVEELYESYLRFKTRIDFLRHTLGVNVVEVDAAGHNEPRADRFNYERPRVEAI